MLGGSEATYQIFLCLKLREAFFFLFCIIRRTIGLYPCISFTFINSLSEKINHSKFLLLAADQKVIKAQSPLKKVITLYKLILIQWNRSVVKTIRNLKFRKLKYVSHVR